MHYRGQGVPQDDAAAVQWLKKSAEQGFVKAQYFLGMRYALGHHVPKDRALANYWLGKAAEQGDEEARSRLSNRRARGFGVTGGDSNAKAWNSLEESAKAMYVVGYKHGMNFVEMVKKVEKTYTDKVNIEKIVELLDALYSTKCYETCFLEHAMNVAFMNVSIGLVMKDFWEGIEVACKPKK
jgi:hypothetical protein